jgi:hypothetical protein
MMLLPWIGTRDDVELRGYVIERCPACGTVGVFGVYDAKRRLTIYLIPTPPFSQQQLMECKTCHARFGVPEDQRAALAKRLMSQDELSARIKELGGGRDPSPNGQYAVGAGAAPAAPAQPTLYQVLQVDPSADLEVIEAAFKRLAFKYHPDRSTAPDAAARMRELIEAREILTDPQRRAAYDARLRLPGRRPAPAPDRQPPPPPRPTPPRPPAMRPEEV